MNELKVIWNIIQATIFAHLWAHEKIIDELKYNTVDKYRAYV